MVSQLNIKSEDGYRLATELSALTGESLTTAVTEALRERLEREQHGRDKSRKLARLTALAGEIRASLRPAALADTPGERGGDLLFNAGGLPK